MSAAIKIEGLQVRTVLRDKTEAGVGDLFAAIEMQRLQARTALRDKFPSNFVERNPLHLYTDKQPIYLAFRSFSSRSCLLIGFFPLSHHCFYDLAAPKIFPCTRQK